MLVKMMKINILVSVTIAIIVFCSAEENVSNKHSEKQLLSLNNTKKLKNPLANLIPTNLKLFENVPPDEIISHNNFKGEKHVVSTSDGYEICLYRITGNQTNPSPKGKPPILLQHGLFGSSKNWISAGPKHSFAFLLADHGFDVWLGNFRGSIYSRTHSKLHLNQSEFWNYSWHELGVYDLPAQIDYILEKSEYKKIIYIGHSQGTTASYVMLSERPEYNDKVLAIFSLAPVSFFLHARPTLKLVSFLYYGVTRSDEYHEVTFNIINNRTITKFCEMSKSARQFCKNSSVAKNLQNSEYNPDQLFKFFEFFPAGASVKQVNHFAQLMISGRFCQFDYGMTENRKKYNKFQPPDYKLSNIKVPATLFYSMNDPYTPQKDVEKLYSKLSNPNGLYRVEDLKFNHIDFLWGKHVKQLVYDKVIAIIQNNFYKS